MNKLICAAAVSAAICAPIAANAFSDVMDPAYETKELLENYRISEQKSNEIVFKNTKAPSSEIKIKFAKLGERTVTDVLLDHVYSSYRNQQLNHCQSDESLAGMGAFEFTCINNQSNIVHFAVTGFANADGSPKSFIRIVDSSAVSGDNAPAEDLAELINFANFKLGYFEEGENEEATTLKHATMRELHDIDLTGIENMVYEASNFWNGKKPSSPVGIENIDVSDKGIKYFLRTSDNKPLYAVIHLDERRDISMLVKESLELSNRGCDKPQMASSPFGSDVDAFRVSCQDAVYGTYFKELKLKKDKLNSYLILTGEENTAVNLGTNGFNQLALYLYEDFFKREIMLSRDNIFAYMDDIDSGRLQPVSKSYMTDTQKAKDERTESEDKAFFATAGSTQNETAAGTSDDGMLLPLIGIAILLLAGGAGAFVYMQKKKGKSSSDDNNNQEPVHETSDGTEMDLTAEIQAAQMEKARLERESQKQRREAELIAKKLEEARKNESPEERRKRLEEIEKQNQEDLAKALSQPKETVAAANIEAQKQMKQMQESGSTGAENPAKASEENISAPAQDAETQAPKKQAASAEEFEEQLQQELKAEAERRKKEEPVKLKGGDLLAKMNQSRDDSAKNDSSIPDARVSSSQIVAFSKKDDADRPVLRMVKEDKKPEPEAKSEKPQAPAPTKMSDLSALGTAGKASKSTSDESIPEIEIEDDEKGTSTAEAPNEEKSIKGSAFNTIPGFETVDAEPAKPIAKEPAPATQKEAVHNSFASIPGMETVDSDDSSRVAEDKAKVKTLSSVAPSSFSSIPGMETVDASPAAEEEKPIHVAAQAHENGVKKKAKNPFDAIVKTGKGTAQAAQAAAEQEQNAESSEVLPKQEPDSKPEAKKTTTRKIRKFNMGSLSISIKNPDNE